MNLIEILEKTVSSDKNELETAQHYLEHAGQQNIVELLKQLSDILKNVNNSLVARRQAGIQLKNALYSKDQAKRQAFQQRWLTIPEDVRAYIKNNVLETLGTETKRPSIAAQCVAYISFAELPNNQWSEMMQTLTNNVTNPSSSEMMKEASLQAIGYICQDIDPEVLLNISNMILTAIICGMKKEEPSNNVRLAATNALLNSLEFTRANFDSETERNFIMQVVCETTQSSETSVRVAALQCLVKIISLYYHYIQPYMSAALYPITLEAVRSSVDKVALQGIEFWSTVCDEEVDLAIELSEANEQGRDPERVSNHYAKGALQCLVPLLTNTLARQEEFEDDDEWNPSKAAGICLILLASCCEDDIVSHVLPFVTEHIKNADWKYRDAAVMAFGSILEGPKSETLKPIVEQAMPTLIELMKDPSIAVRDSAAWTIGKVCELIPDAVINENLLNLMLRAMVEGLNSEPRVAANVCWAFTSLSEAAYESAYREDEDSVPATYTLSPYYEPIMQKLLETTIREDGCQYNLRSAAYEAIMELIKNSPKDCYLTIQKTTLIILERLQHVLQMEGSIQSTSDRTQLNDLQSLLCATLQNLLRKVNPADAPQISDTIMRSLLQMLSSSSGKTGGVQEDALLAVSTLVEAMGQGFIKYMDAFNPFFLAGLKNHEEHLVCQAAVGLVGDISRALGQNFIPYCDSVMFILLQNLENSTVNKDIKPHIFSTFGDVALSIGPEFRKYLPHVLTVLGQASKTNVDKSDFDLVDYLNNLREGCLESYTGIIHCLKGEDNIINPADLEIMKPGLSDMINLITNVAIDDDISDTVLGASCGLVGDLCSAFGVSVLQVLDNDIIQNLLSKGKKSKSNKVKNLASWAFKEMRKLKNQK